MQSTMNAFEATGYESDTFDSSEEDFEVENEPDVLSFCDKITEELKLCFGRNCGSDDFCEDIYDDKFKTPKSGRHSYYADILAVAQLNEKDDNGPNIAMNAQGSTRRMQEGTIIHPSHWTCTGQWNPTTGTGPFEELFQVLEDHHQGFSRSQTSDQPVLPSIFFPQEWAPGNSSLASPYDDELIGIASINSDYPTFIDSFHRWNSDSCAMLPSTNQTNFLSHDYHSSF